MKDTNRYALSVTVGCVAMVLAMGLCFVASAQEPPKTEADLISTLKSDASWEEKHIACRALRQVGTSQAVTALAALLPDPKTSHMARYALEAIPGPEAGQALRDALATTEGLPRMGVVISLGARKDADAVPLLLPLLKDADADLARAAIGAMGRIATPDSAKALLDLRADAPESVRSALADGLLALGQRLTQEGKGKEAASIFQDVLDADWPMNARLGAFRGLAAAQPDQAPAQLLAALRGDQPLLRDLAAQLIAETSVPATTKGYVAALPQLPAGGQVALIRSLADLGDTTTRPAVASAITSPDRGVRLEAVKALTVLGNASDAGTLIGLLSSGDAETAAAAEATLTNIEGDAMDAAIASALADATPAIQAQLLGLLAERRAAQAVPSAIANLEHESGDVRVAGLDVIARLGGLDQASVAAQRVTLAKDESERSAAENALSAISARTGDQVVPIVLKAMNGAGIDAKLALLRTLARIGGPKAVEAVVAAVSGEDKQLSEEALRLLSNWPSLEAAPHLLTLAKSDDLSRQVLGLRGYVRLAETAPKADEKIRMFTEAMAAAKRPDEKKLVLAAWGTLPTVKSLDNLQPYLDDPEVRAEAAAAIIAVAPELAKNKDAKPKAAAALQAAVEKCGDTDTGKQAQETLQKLP
jgi:HEAT repeat protein